MPALWDNRPEEASYTYDGVGVGVCSVSVCLNVHICGYTAIVFYMRDRLLLK